ncbi:MULTISPECIES: hypothetical protein [Oceanisphaera]|uniref:Uncharacterized protein n=1 Tax=Oceanisphaera ostreae TaxID=914151 RepID=A0ABW3KFU7_9GAMM
MLKRRRLLLKQRKTATCSPRRKILMKDVRRNILRRNNAYFLEEKAERTANSEG